ncbi:MAG: DMT family transporter, partial [Coriobacteriia bacterium]|nr:DMT family transporter [Coriobacteriia bacterium]
RAVIIGVAVGVCSGVGVSSFYVALARGKMTTVAPLTAALSAALPLLWDLTRGAALSATSLAGVVFALIATAAVGLSSSEAADDVGDGTSDSTDVGTGDGDKRKMTPLAFMLTLVASLGFAGMYFGFAATPSDSGFWPLLAARITSTLTLTLATTFAKGRSLKLGRKAWPLVLGAGVLDAVANIMVLTALRLGPFSVAVVLSSLYPVTTVLLARAILGERLKGIQRAAVAIAFASVVLAAWP